MKFVLALSLLAAVAAEEQSVEVSLDRSWIICNSCAINEAHDMLSAILFTIILCAMNSHFTPFSQPTVS